MSTGHINTKVTTDQLRQLVREAVTSGDKRVKNFITWFKDNEEYYAVQQGSIQSPLEALGMIYKNVLYRAIIVGADDWEAIEPFYGQDFEEATKILVNYLEEKIGVSVGKKYDLPEGLYAVEMIGNNNTGYNKKLRMCLKDGTIIGNYYPGVKTIYIPNYDNSGQFTEAGVVENLTQAAFRAYGNYEQNRVKG